MLVVAFPPKLQIINVSQHLQETKACSPAARCRSGRLGYQASHINIAAVRGADVSGGLHEQDYNWGDYRGHLRDSLGNTSGPAKRCVSPYGGSVSRAAGSGDFCPRAVPQGRAELSKQTPGEGSPWGDVQCHGHLFLGKTLVFAQAKANAPIGIQRGLGFHPELSSRPRACSGVVRRLDFGCPKEVR